MKVFILMYYYYDETECFGVFSSEDKANQYASEIAKNNDYINLQYFFVNEEEVQ